MFSYNNINYVAKKRILLMHELFQEHSWDLVWVLKGATIQPPSNDHYLSTCRLECFLQKAPVHSIWTGVAEIDFSEKRSFL